MLQPHYCSRCQRPIGVILVLEQLAMSYHSPVIVLLWSQCWGYWWDNVGDETLLEVSINYSQNPIVLL